VVERRKVIIMGAAGRDFHNFNVLYREREDLDIVAFTATQIPGIGGRVYPASLAGRLYPKGIPIHPEEELPELIRKQGVERVVFAYSDVSHEEVMHKASQANALGADFILLGTGRTTLKADRPVVAVCAVRTGAGKSQTTRRVAKILLDHGKKVVVVRHPMPYGILENQTVQRFATHQDLDRHECTIEEREEYEPHIDRGIVVFAGIDYERILREAEKEADVILWDGGNNDTPFYRPDLHIVVVDPLRPGDEITYHPGETNLRMADVVVVNKIDSAKPEDIESVKRNVESVNPEAVIIEAASPVSVIDPEPIKGKRVLVVEDGPTLTHGDMEYGAATIAARRFDAKEIVDAEPLAVGSIKKVYVKYPRLKRILPAMGYGGKQVKELEETINAADCDLVLSGTPVDLRRIVKVNKPIVRVRYELDEIGHPNLEDVLREHLGL